MVTQAYNLLKDYNLRITPQREAILQLLLDSRGHHLETELIYKKLNSKDNQNKRIGMATVYRTMELFEKIGLISRLSMENSPARYELIAYDQAMHHHLICLKCGNVQEIEDWLAGEFKSLILGDKGFKVADKPMKIYGYCSQCS